MHFATRNEIKIRRATPLKRRARSSATTPERIGCHRFARFAARKAARDGHKGRSPQNYFRVVNTSRRTPLRLHKRMRAVHALCCINKATSIVV
jgi:hypothetical protein